MLALDRYILICTLKVQWEIKMAGEVKSAMDVWRASRKKLVDNITNEINKQIALMPTMEADAKAALQLPAAELNKTRQEIDAIHEEFGSLTNAPDGPLPDSSPVIEKPPMVTGVITGRTDFNIPTVPSQVKQVLNDLNEH